MAHMKNIFICMFIIIIGFAGSVFGQATEYRFASFDLGTLGGDASVPRSIRNDGTVTGASWFPGNIIVHAVIFQDDNVIDLGTLGGSLSGSADMNDQGVVVGAAYNDKEKNSAFMWEDGVMTNLGTLGGKATVAESLNEHGEIVGGGNIKGNFFSHGFLYKDGKMIDLGSLRTDGGSSDAADINESGQIAGWSATDGENTAILWENGHVIDLGGLCEFCRSEARAINDLGQVVGWSWNNELQLKTTATLWVNGRVVNLQIGSSGIKWSYAQGVNNVGQIVGFAQEPGGKNRDNGFLWEQGKGMQLLKNLVAPKSGMQIDLAYDINDNGEIAARAYRLNDGFFRALKLVPVNPEMTLSDPVPGVAGVVNSWTVTNAVPGAKVTLVYGFKGGGTRFPGCNVLDAAVQIDSPKVVKTVVADGNGVATIDMFVPGGAKSLGGILVQAVSLGECQESELTVVKFE